MEFSLERFNIEHLPNVKKLKLVRPLVIFDTETTGLNIAIAEIVELMAIKLHPDGTHEELYSLFLPKGSVLKAASDVHGYTKDKLVKAKAPSMKDKIHEIHNFFSDCDLSAYNGVRFDIPLLMEEFRRHKKDFDLSTCNILDPFLLMPKVRGLSNKLSEVYKRFFNEDLVNAHTASADVIATVRVFDRQIEILKLPKVISEICEKKKDVITERKKKPASYKTTKPAAKVSKGAAAKQSKKGNDEYLVLDIPGRLFKARQNDSNYYFNKGKHNGEKIEKKHVGYMKWVIEKSDFDQETKNTANKLIKTLSK